MPETSLLSSEQLKILLAVESAESVSLNEATAARLIDSTKERYDHCRSLRKARSDALKSMGFRSARVFTAYARFLGKIFAQRAGRKAAAKAKRNKTRTEGVTTETPPRPFQGKDGKIAVTLRKNGQYAFL